jgi:hypothetical protein
MTTEAQDMIRAVFEDGEATLDSGNTYVFTKMTHKERRKVFAFYTHIAAQVQTQDLSFLDAPEFEAVEAIVNKRVTYAGSLLSVLGDAHWDKYPSDYIPFITTALMVISFPFFPAGPTA